LDLPDCTSFFLPTTTSNEVFGAERAIWRILNRSNNHWNKFLVCDSVNILKTHSNCHVLYAYPSTNNKPNKSFNQTLK
jgi:hypothetical protein